VGAGSPGLFGQAGLMGVGLLVACRRGGLLFPVSGEPDADFLNIRFWARGLGLG